MSNGSLPVHDIAAEEAVNGSLLIDGNAFQDIADIVEPTDFYNEANRWIFSAAKALCDSGEAIDQITVAQRLQAEGHLDTSGGAAYLSHLISIVPTSLDIEHYAKITRRLSQCRRFDQLGQRMQDWAQKPLTLEKSLEKADEELMELRKTASPSEIVTPKERANLVLERYPALLDKQVSKPTGLGQLDRNIGGGLFDSDLIYVAARPGMGKTTFLQTVWNNMSRRYKVLVASVEMSMESITDRDIAGIFQIPIVDVRAGNYTQETLDAMLGLGVQTIADRQVYFIRSGSFTTTVISRAAAYMQQRYGLDAVFIDYLGLLSDSYGKNENDRLGFISRSLKNMARTLNIPVIAAHQLSRKPEGRADDDKRPRLSDLRDSGRLEEDADLVFMLYREKYYKPDSQNENGELIISKQRQGESNITMPLHFDNKRHRYFCVDGRPDLPAPQQGRLPYSDAG